ncbi:MAG: DUF805 domain-containing protein [Pseudomonadota bacterium]
MTFTDAVRTVLANYANFDGRSGRAEFWWWFLAYLIAYVVASAVGNMLGMGSLLASILALAVVVPSFAVSARRFHDIGMTGWLSLLLIVPLVNLIVMLVFFTRTSAGPNQYGEGPQGPAR